MLWSYFIVTYPTIFYNNNVYQCIITNFVKIYIIKILRDDYMQYTSIDFKSICGFGENSKIRGIYFSIKGNKPKRLFISDLLYYMS